MHFMGDGIDFWYGYIKLMAFIAKASLDYENVQRPLTQSMEWKAFFPACQRDPGGNHQKSSVVGGWVVEWCDWKVILWRLRFL